MALLKEFKDFALRGNVVDLAVAVVIGGAFGKIVSAAVDDLVMPPIGALMGKAGGDWRELTATSLNLKVGHFASTVIDFVLIVAFIFIVVVKLMGALAAKAAPVAAPEAPKTKVCSECLDLIPLAARRCRSCTAVAAALLLCLLPTGARAQNPADPKFAYGKVEAAKTVEWTAQVKGGLLLSTGNSEARNGSLGGAASRKSGDNKLALDVGGAYGKSTVRAARDANMDKILSDDSELGKDEIPATNNWNTRGRYDRFFTANNAGYLLGQIGADRIAGKRLMGGGQAGYSRQLIKNESHTWVAEAGYDLSFESYLSAPMGSADSVAIHSARVFLGDVWKISEATGVYANTELLLNLNKEDILKASDKTGATKGVDAFGDTRLVAKAGLTTTLWKNVSFGFGFTARYDQNPAPRAAPKGFSYGPGFQAFGDKVDTATEATLIVTFL